MYTYKTIITQNIEMNAEPEKLKYTLDEEQHKTLPKQNLMKITVPKK